MSRGWAIGIELRDWAHRLIPSCLAAWDVPLSRLLLAHTCRAEILPKNEMRREMELDSRWRPILYLRCHGFLTYHKKDFKIEFAEALPFLKFL
jgi:hypothetical protein